MQASFLDFTLFEDDPKFFSEYVVMDTKTHKVYTDKFRMLVINLKKTREAAQEERRYSLDDWAAMFAARKWEELKMLAQKNPVIDEAVGTAYKLMLDERERYRMEAREDALNYERAMQRKMAEVTQKCDEATQKCDELTRERDEITRERDEVTRERDEITRERDKALEQLSASNEENKMLKAELEMLRKKQVNQENT